MSRYSDKKSTAVCAGGDCPNPADQLRIVNSRPDWYCDVHSALVDERKGVSGPEGGLTW